jgi:hypothetical protein
MAEADVLIPTMMHFVSPQDGRPEHAPDPAATRHRAMAPPAPLPGRKVQGKHVSSRAPVAAHAEDSGPLSSAFSAASPGSSMSLAEARGPTAVRRKDFLDPDLTVPLGGFPDDSDVVPGTTAFTSSLAKKMGLSGVLPSRALRLWWHVPELVGLVSFAPACELCTSELLVHHRAGRSHAEIFQRRDCCRVCRRQLLRPVAAPSLGARPAQTFAREMDLLAPSSARRPPTPSSREQEARRVPETRRLLVDLALAGISAVGEDRFVAAVPEQHVRPPTGAGRRAGGAAGGAAEAPQGEGSEEDQCALLLLERQQALEDRAAGARLGFRPRSALPGAELGRPPSLGGADERQLPQRELEMLVAPLVPRRPGASPPEELACVPAPLEPARPVRGLTRSTVRRMMAKCRWLRTLSEAEAEELLRYVVVQRAPPNAVLLREGDRGSFLVVVAEGEVEVYRSGRWADWAGEGAVGRPASQTLAASRPPPPSPYPSPYRSPYCTVASCPPPFTPPCVTGVGGACVCRASSREARPGKPHALTNAGRVREAGPGRDRTAARRAPPGHGGGVGAVRAAAVLPRRSSVRA